MLTKLLYLWLLLYSSLIIITTHPLPFGLIILVFTCLTTLTMATTLNSLWFSYILFLIYLGLLILFIYVTSLVPNKKLSMNYKMTTTIILMSLATTILINKYHPYCKILLLINLLPNPTNSIMVINHIIHCCMNN